MFNSFRNRAANFIATCMVAILFVAAPAIGKGALTDSKGVLKYVPEDTPYIFASGTPLPDKTMDALEPRIDEMLKAYQVFFREVLRSSMAKNSTDMSVADLQRMSAVVDEITKLFSIEGLRNAGFERGAGLVIYGNGILPVLRIELGDATKFEAAIVRMETAAGTSMDATELDGNEYRFVGDEDGRLIIGVFDDNAVFTIAPGALEDEELKSLLGLTLPKKNIARSGKLQALVDEYDFTDYYVGYVDNLRIASTLLGEANGIDAVLFESAEYDSDAVSEVCKDEIREVVGIAPRMIVGYGEMSSELMAGALVVELRSDIAAGLSTLSAVVPGLGIDPGGLFSFGMSLNIPSLRSFAEARFDAMEEDPFKCEHFAELQAGVAKGRASLAQPLPPFINGMRGFNVIVDDLGDYDMASGVPPQKVDASVVLAMDDAQAMFMMGSMMSPDLAAVDLQPNGVPVPLVLPQIQAVANIAYAAMDETTIAVSMGGDAKTRVSGVLAGASAEPPIFMSASVDAQKYYELIAQGMMAKDDEAAENDEEGADEAANPLSEPARIALRDALLKIGEMYDRMLVDVRLTKRGIEMDSKVSLSD